MTNQPSRNDVTPGSLGSAIDQYFGQYTAEEIVTKAEAMRPKSSRRYYEQEQNLSRMTTQAGWLLMICEGDKCRDAISFALRVCKKLTDFRQLIAESVDQCEPSTVITVHSTRMLVSQPTVVADVLHGLIESTKFKELERKLADWASITEAPPKKQLLEASELFARLTPILEENAI